MKSIRKIMNKFNNYNALKTFINQLHNLKEKLKILVCEREREREREREKEKSKFILRKSFIL
jgi:hypothetical protein